MTNPRSGPRTRSSPSLMSSPIPDTQGAQEELSPGLLDEDDAPPASGEAEQLPASVQAVAEDAPSPAAEAADAHPVDGDHALADEDLITQIDEDPGEWARAALSDFQDLDD